MDRQHPRQADDGRYEYRHGPVTQQFPQASLPEHVGQGDQGRQQQSEKTFGHEACATGKAQQGPGAEPAARGTTINGEPQCHQAQVDPKRELRIEVGVAGLAGDQPETHINQRAGKAFTWVIPETAAYQKHQPDTQAGTQRRGNAYSEQVVAKDSLADRHHPITGDGFFKVANTHEMGRDPVTAQQHFLADLAISGFIWNPQAMGHKWQQVEKGECQCQGGHYPALGHWQGLTGAAG
jgi:hypothetical protein